MDDDVSRRDDKVIAEWSVHRIRQDPRKMSAVILLLILANTLLLLIHRALYSAFPYLVLLGNLILIGSLSDYLFPVRFRLTSEGADYRNLILKKRISWAQVRNCYVSDQGIKLSPLKRSSRLESFRGFVLLFNNNREEVIEHVKRLAANRSR